jgi:general secretion pathway protein I
MIALGALALILGVLITIAARSVRAANRAKMLTVATELARGKMLDVEESLLKDGFQETAETMEGDFSDEGFDHITWHALIEKVELPEVDDLQSAADDATGAGSPLGEMLGAGQGGGQGAEAAAGASMLMSQFGMVKGVLELAIRKVTLTVTWKVAGNEEKLEVVCYFTDPKAVDQALGGLPSL